ncbi:MAG: hypothetical protein LBD23_02565 [Oscillospiraceae bacterium]|nr:hypothetical protein [Oscillospiraceae bacterium]
MKLNKITERDFKHLSPKNSTFSFFDISPDLKDYMLLNISLYRKLLVDYLLKITNIRLYDKQLLEEKYLQIPTEAMDMYQYFSQNELHYIYLRNNIYIERLTDIEKDFLAKKIETENFDLDEESQKMIESSFRRVIFEDELGNGEIFSSDFAPDSSTFRASNDSLVLGIRYDELNLNGMDSNAWGRYHDEKMRNLYLLSDKIENEIAQILNMPVEVFIYDDYTVTPRNTAPNFDESKKNNSYE